MYRTAYTSCVTCGHPLPSELAEFDAQGQFVCTPCNARARVSSALVRFRADNRQRRWMRLGAAALGLGVLATLPTLFAMFLITGTVAAFAVADQS